MDSYRLKIMQSPIEHHLMIILIKPTKCTVNMLYKLKLL